MVIERMEARHVPAAARLERECFSAPWSERSLLDELTNPLSTWLVAMDGEVLAGYIGSQAVLDEADMMNLAVAPEYRRRGVGAALTEALAAALQARGVAALTLEVRASNAPAIALYEKLGFVQVGRRPRYYEKPREDALILRKEWQL